MQATMPPLRADTSAPADSFTCEVPTTCQPPSAWCKDPWPAVIRDIRTTRLLLTLQRRFERGSGMAVEIPTEDGGSTTILGRVTSVQTLEPGTFLLECTFISELGDEEVEHVLRVNALQHAALECPDAPGATAGTSIDGVLFQAKMPGGEILRWYVKHLAHPGTWPLPHGKKLTFRVGEGGSATQAELRVKTCRRHGSFWVVDCKPAAGGMGDDVIDALARQ